VFFLGRLGRKHQLDELFGDVGLEPFGVTLAFSNHIRDDAAALAAGVFEDLGGAGPGEASPTIGTGVLTGWRGDAFVKKVS